MEYRVVVGQRRQLQSRPGQGLVEFVLIAPLLLLLIFGLVEFARAWNIRHVVTDAAREGARTMAVWPDNNQTAAQDSALKVVQAALLSNGMDTTNATITPVAPAGNASGSPVTVSITYPYDFGIVKAFLSWTTAQGHVDIQTVFTMRKE